MQTAWYYGSVQSRGNDMLSVSTYCIIIFISNLRPVEGSGYCCSFGLLQKPNNTKAASKSVQVSIPS